MCTTNSTIILYIHYENPLNNLSNFPLYFSSTVFFKVTKLKSMFLFLTRGKVSFYVFPYWIPNYRFFFFSFSSTNDQWLPLLNYKLYCYRLLKGLNSLLGQKKIKSFSLEERQKDLIDFFICCIFNFYFLLNPRMKHIYWA